MAARATASILRFLITAPPSSWWCGLYGKPTSSTTTPAPRSIRARNGVVRRVLRSARGRCAKGVAVRISVVRLLCSAVVLACVPVVATPTARVQAASPNVVISQVYGAGGNSGALLSNDYIELFNRGATTVSLDGWSVQYASATGTGTVRRQPDKPASDPSRPASTTSCNRRRVAPAAARSRRRTRPARSPWRAGAGKVILANTTTGLACNGSSTPCSAAQLAQIVDLVGYGTANFFEGTGPRRRPRPRRPTSAPATAASTPTTTARTSRLPRRVRATPPRHSSRVS